MLTIRNMNVKCNSTQNIYHMKAYNFGMQHVSYKVQNNFRNTAFAALVIWVVLAWNQSHFVKFRH